MDKVQYFLKKHSTLILTIAASCGVITTTVLAVKATPKAIKLLDEAEKKKGGSLTVIEKVKYGWSPYVYCGLSSIATLLCIASIEYLNHQRQVSLVSAYALLENSFSRYRDNIKDTCGDDVDFIARQEIVKARYETGDVESPEDDDELLFFDYQGMRFFRSSMQNVIKAEHQILESIRSRGYASLNEYYDFLGIPRLNYGYQLGWLDCSNYDLSDYNIQELEFNYEKTMVGDNRDIECWIITASLPATFDYIL